MKSSLNQKVIWGHIKSIRLKYLMTTNVDLMCKNSISDQIFIPEKDIINNLEKLSTSITINTDNQMNRTLSKNEVNAGAEMFVALNSCPSYFVKLYWKAIYGPKSRIAMLASNILKQAKDGFETMAMKIFAKISSTLGFHHISDYDKGDNNVAKSKYNAFKKDFMNIKGETI